MAPDSYHDFDLQFERVADGYQVTARGQAGVSTHRFQLAVTPTELENLVLRIGRTRRSMRRLGPPDVAAARQFGQRLFTAVFADDVAAAFRRSLDLADQQQAGLRLRLRFAQTPELADYPWEYLYDPAHDRFLALSVETPVVRYLDIPDRIRPLTVAPPLRILAVIASPRGVPPLDTEREWGNIQAALAELAGRGAVRVERLERATLGDLQRRLRRGEYHILHFVGHGQFDPQLQDGVLLLEDPQGDGDRVSGQELGTLLHDHRALRLVILNACEGGRAAADDPFAGVAQSLVQQRIPAVIGMQFEVSDEAAIAVAHEFYSALADGYPVDAALTEARKYVFAQGYRLEWGTPVLYLRAPDGRIFETPASSPQGPAPPVPAGEPLAGARDAPIEASRSVDASEQRLDEDAQDAPAREPWKPRALNAGLPARLGALLGGRSLLFLPAAVVLNIAVGQLRPYRAPIFIDSLGTVIAGALFGPWIGMATGVITNLIWSLIGLNPKAWMYAPVAAVIGLGAGLAGRRGVFTMRSPRALSSAMVAVAAAALAWVWLTTGSGIHTTEGEFLWSMAALDHPAGLATLVGALVGGAVVGAVWLRDAGYAGLVGALVGAVGAIASAVVTMYVGQYSTEIRPELLAWLWSQLALSDGIDKLVVFVAAWALLRALASWRGER